MIILVSLVIASIAAYAFGAVFLVRRFGIARRDWITASVLFVWAVAVVAKVQLDRLDAERSDPVAVALSVGPMQASELAGRALAGNGGDGSLPPVAALIGGLEARLAEEPDDAKGWSLLAQSYAFVGNTGGAESAIARAVALGMDEASLRERVDGALRPPHPVQAATTTAGL